MCIVEVNTLLQALIERMAFWSWDKPEREQTNTLALFCDELTVAPVQQLHLPLPQDPRLQTWLAEGRSISTVAFDLDFASDSAFISFFRQHTGSTPTKYLTDTSEK